MIAMFFTPRIPLKSLIGLCRRTGMSLEAGIDARTMWAREADRATGPLRRQLRSISEDVNRGGSLAEALAQTGDFFPRIFREMVEVGEETGHVDDVLLQLADHYQNRLTMRRTFLATIAWPMFQLFVSLFVIGALIWIMGMLREITGNRSLDILGFGLVGNQGLAIYLCFLALAAAAIWLFIRAVNRGVLWVQPIQRLVLRIPAIGAPLQTIALERLAWSLHLTMNTGMSVRRALRLSLSSTQNARYTSQIPAIDAEIVGGSSIHEAFRQVGGYPVEFLDTLAVAEESGKISESMGLLARQYQERAKMALAALAVVAGWVVWAAIAAVIIVLIFRLFSFYLGAIYDAMKP